MFGFLKKKQTVDESTQKNEPQLNGSQDQVDKSLNEEHKVHTEQSQGKMLMVEDAHGGISFSDSETKDSKERISKKVELESHIGKLVICISEKLENPIVAVGINLAYIKGTNTPVLSVYDIVKKEKMIHLGMLFEYTEQKFDALNKMDANGRIALFFNRLGSNTIELKPKPESPLCVPDEWKFRVSEAIKKINRGDWS